MTGIDWLIVGFVVLLALYGYTQGFLVGALSLAGFAGGAVLGTRLGPQLLPGGSTSPYAPLFGLLGALVAGGVLALGLEGVALSLRSRVRLAALAAVDGLLGAGLTAFVALGVSWIVGAVVLQTPGARALRPQIQRSLVLRELNRALPPSGPILNALARFDPFPRIRGPRPQLSRPDSAIARDPAVRAASPSVVRVLGTACGLGVQGSGWVGSPGLVVTNAHVVAGEDSTTVQLDGDGIKLDAQAVHFDPRNDLAVLRVPSLDRRRLPLAADPSPGSSGAVLGFPGNGPYDVQPARLGPTVSSISQDAYGRGPVRRLVTVLRGDVRSGDSGGPMVDGAGRVVTTVFAATVGARSRGGYGVPNAVVRAALRDSSHPVGTGPCAGG
ncbi:MAG: MarP family serine protease [Solirubrobacteraceae bacterium]|jgi:S1-C subfamily serine protease